MSLINISNLTFAYPGSYDNIFENVSFQIDTNWKLGFVGRNGRGKTTFLNLLRGNYDYAGSITAGVEFDYFPFDIEDTRVDTVEVVNRVCAEYQYWELVREFNLLQVSENVLYRPFETLSNGERTKVMLAALFLSKNKFLLIDEPTNHLDIIGRKIVSEYLRGKAGFILVSHDRCFLDECVDHILSINRNNIEIERGNFSSWFANKENRDRFELAENEKLKKEVKRLTQTAAEKAQWSSKAEARKIGFDPTKTEKNTNRRAYEGAKSKKAMKRSKVLERRQSTAVEEKAKLLKNIEMSSALKLAQPEYFTAQLLAFHKVTIAYGETVVCNEVSFTVEKGERVSLAGINGSGKSSMLKLICGEDVPYTGEVIKNARLQISYVFQDASVLNGSLAQFIRAHALDESLFKAVLRKLDFQRVQFEKDIGEYSSGQKKKLLIAKSLCEKSHLLIWDEPLN